MSGNASSVVRDRETQRMVGLGKLPRERREAAVRKLIELVRGR